MDTSYFYTQFAAYNTDWLMANILLWIILVTTTVAVLVRPESHRANTAIKAALALVCLWNGIVFFQLYMTESAVAGGIPFILAGLLLAADTLRNRIHIRVPASGWQRTATLVLVVWALGLYTITGWVAGHAYPAGPLPAAPCPTTILAIALLSTSMATLKTDRRAFTLLFAALIWWTWYAGLGSTVIYGFYLDLTLFAAGIYGMMMLKRHWHTGDTVSGKSGSE